MQDPAEETVKEWLEESSLEVVVFSKEEQRQGIKTPDFKAYKTGGMQFYCEVKCIVDSAEENHDEELNDTTPDQLTGDIHDAFKKFKAVNSDHYFPNVLAFVNMKDSAGVDYLDDVLLGRWYMGNGKRYPLYVRYSNGRIKDEKSLIDLYVWFGKGDRVKFRFTGAIKKHFELLCALFGIDSATVKRLDA